MKTKQKQIVHNEAYYESQAQEYVLNALLMREEWIRRLGDPRRDIDEECRYPRVVTPEMYRRMYNRFGIAKRVVSIEPVESWSIKPEIYDAEEAEETDFEEKWKTINERHKLMSKMIKADVLSGIGRYGLILYGINDGKPLSSPVQGMPKSGMLDAGGYKVKRPETEILFIRIMDETLAPIVQWDTNSQSPRFGMPQYYQLRLLSPEDLAEGYYATQPPINLQDTKVHWTRVTHIARDTTSSEVFGTPQMEDVYNHLLDLKKVLGAGAEGYWQAGFPGLSFETQPNLENFEVDVAGLRKQARKYFEKLQRYIATVGMNVKSLAPNIQDPSTQFETNIKAICTAKGIPYRIFMGTEEAKLAGDEDKDSWKGRCIARQLDHNEPNIVRPVTERLIMYNALPIPLEQKFTVEWPDMHGPTDKEVADTANVISTALKNYVSAGIDELIGPEDFLVQVMKFDPKVVKVILDNALQRAADINTGSEDVVMGGPSPEEVKQQAQQELLQKQAGRMNGKVPPNGKPANGKAPAFNSNGKHKKGSKNAKRRRTTKSV
jgi:hypothetical protein